MLKRLKLWKLWMRLSYYFQLSHHPLCERYADQRYEFAGIHICQGCTAVTTGTATALIFGIVAASTFPLLPWYIATAVALLTVVPAYFIDRVYSGRWSKRFARFATGLGLGYATTLVIFTRSWPLKIFYLVSIMTVYKAYRAYRVRHPPKNLCIGCEHEVDKPNCPGYRQQIDANKVYMKMATDILAPEINERIKQLSATSDFRQGRIEP